MSKAHLIAGHGSQGVGVVVRISAITTESVYKFLKLQLASMEPYLGAAPYHRS